MTENNLKTRLENLSEMKGGMATHLPNVSYLRVKKGDGSVDYYTMTANRY